MAFDLSAALNDPIRSMLAHSASKSAPELGSSLSPQSRQLSQSSIHVASQRNGEKPNENITAFTTSEPKLTRKTQSVEPPIELDLDTVEEDEEVIYISSSDSLSSTDHKSRNETDIERNTGKESNPANVSTDSREKTQEHAQRKNIQTTQNIPRKQASVGHASGLSSLPNMRDTAPTTTHDVLKKPMIQPRSIEHQRHKYPSESRKRQLVNNSQNCCNTSSKVPKRDKSPPLTLTLTIPQWVNHKELCSKFFAACVHMTKNFHVTNLTYRHQVISLKRVAIEHERFDRLVVAICILEKEDCR
jgi:hypothetical protein